MSETAVVEFEEKTVLAAFTADKGLDPLIAEARELVNDFEHDLTTVTGRAKTASLAAKVAKLKTRLDGLGKDLVADWKKQAGVVDGVRRQMRDDLDELKIEARKPLTDWEDEQRRIEAEQAAEEEAEQLRQQKENDHEFAMLLNDNFEHEKREAEKQVELEQKEAAEQAERDKEQAQRDEEKREQDRQAEAERKAKEDAEAEVLAEKQRAENAERAQREAEEATARAEREAEIAAETARLAEIKRQEDAEAAEKAEIEKREANTRHVGKVRREAKEAIMQVSGVTESVAKDIVLAINAEKIPHVSISY